MLQSNKYSLHTALIFLLIFTLIGGSHLVVCYIGGVEFSAYRFVLMLCVFYLLLTKQLVLYTNRFSKYVLVVFLAWLVYGVMALTWAPSMILGIKELFYIAVGIASYVVYLSFCRNMEGFKRALELLWTMSFVVVSGFLVFELLSQRHFEGEYLQKLAELGSFHKANLIPVFTFINPNILGIYCCISIVLAAYFLISGRNVLLNSVIILAAFDFLLLTESRLGVICVLLLLVITLFLLVFKRVRSGVKWSVSRNRIAAVLVLVAANAWVIHTENQFLKSDQEYLSGSNNPLKSELDKHLRENGKLLLVNADSSSETNPSVSKTDQVFAIEEGSYSRLLRNETLTLQLSEVPTQLQQEVFIGNNMRLLVSMILVLVVLVLFYVFSAPKRIGRMAFLVTCSGLFLLALWPQNSYRYPTEKYKKRVLTEPGFDRTKLHFSNLGVLSSEAPAGELLAKGNRVRMRLYSKERDGDKRLESAPENHLCSDAVRKNLVLNGMDYLEKSRYLGVGPGGFQANNQLKRNKYPDNGVGGAHNFIIEILSQYGVLVFGLLLSLFVWIFYRLFRAFSKGLWSEKHFLVLWLFVTLVLMGNANSTFLSLPMNWVLVILLLVFANELMEPRNLPDEDKL